MRFFDERGPGFVTGTESTKGLEIAATGGIAAALTWPAMFRAIRFRGVAQELSREEVAGYFGSRPWASRISAWASRQSQPIEGRAGLEEAYARYAAQFPDHGNADDVPVPDFWGGYRVVCDEVEFWGGRRNRLHDRLVFSRVARVRSTTPAPGRCPAASPDVTRPVSPGQRRGRARQRARSSCQLGVLLDLVVAVAGVGALAGLTLLAPQQERRQGQQDDRAGQQPHQPQRVGELGLAQQLRRLDRQHDDLLDRGDDPDEEERLGHELAPGQRGAHREEQLDDDEDEQQQVEDVGGHVDDACRCRGRRRSATVLPITTAATANRITATAR